MSAAGPIPRRSLPLGGTAHSAKGVDQSAAGPIRRSLPLGGTAHCANGAQ